MEDVLLLTARYVEGDMNENDRAEFEARLQNDLALRETLENYNDTVNTLKIKLTQDATDLRFKQTLQETSKNYFREKPVIIAFNTYKKWLGAVAAVLVVGLLIWSPWKDSLYTQYADNGQMLVTERGATTQNNLDIAASFFNEKRYNEAEKALEAEYTKKPANSMIAYYYGITLIETNKGNEARKILKQVYDGTSAFKFDAAYKIALSYLKVDKKQACKLWLEKIPADSQRYNQAQELIQKM